MSNDFPNIREETQKLIDNPENMEIEFKESWNAVDQDVLVSFANSKGGTVLIGVEEKHDDDGRQYGNIIGCSGSFDRIRLGIQDRANNCHPPVEIEVSREYGGTNYIYRVDIQESSKKPCCTGSGKYITRKDGQKQAILPDEMSTVILQKEANEFISRLQEAGTRFIEDLKVGQVSLSEQIKEVDDVAWRAHFASERANEAAINASSLAEEAMLFGDESLGTLHEINRLIESIDVMVYRVLTKVLEADEGK